MASSRVMPSSFNTSTYGATGFGRDYVEGQLSTWESATDIDLVTATAGEVLDCYDDQSSFDDGGVILSGETANSSYFRVVRAAAGEGHDGTPLVGIWFDYTTLDEVFRFGTSGSPEWGSLHDLIITMTVNSSSSIEMVDSLTQANVKVVGCFLYNGANAGSGSIDGINTGADGSVVVNCCAIGNDNRGFRVNPDTSATARLYNCTAYGNAAVGFDETNSGTDTCIGKNCLGDSNTSADFSGTWDTGTEYCASGDATAPGTNNRTSQTFTFVAAGSDDVRLASGDGGAKDFGVSLGADSFFAFDDDIAGTTRTGSWDIGFHEVQAGGVVILRRRRDDLIGAV